MILVDDLEVELGELRKDIKELQEAEPVESGEPVDLTDIKNEIKATQKAVLTLKEMVEKNKENIGEVEADMKSDIKKFGEDLSTQLKTALMQYMKVEDIDKLRQIFVTKKDAIDHIEKQISDRKFIQVGPWKLIVGTSSGDFYIKDTINNGYYRLGTTGQNIRLDAAAYHSKGMAAPSYKARPGNPNGDEGENEGE